MAENQVMGGLPKIDNKTQVFTYGKHKGRPVWWVLEHDPWYFTTLQNAYVEISDEIMDEAMENQGEL